MSLRPTDELQAHWDAFAACFARAFEPVTLQLCHSLLAGLRLEGARALLEVGAGAGGGAELARRMGLPDHARHVVTDLSPAMLALARERMAGALQGGQVQVEVADLERLPYGEGSFDRLLGNMVLMLVPDPAQALREARRVLAPGGRLALTVWGRPAHSPMFTLPRQAAEEVGHPEPAGKRSNFHLNDPTRLRELLGEAGFGRVLTWHQTALLPVGDGADFAARVALTPGWREHFAGAPAGLAAFERRLAELADAHLAAGRPIAVEALGALARAV